MSAKVEPIHMPLHCGREVRLEAYEDQGGRLFAHLATWERVGGEFRWDPKRLLLDPKELRILAAAAHRMAERLERADARRTEGSLWRLA